MTGAPTFVIGDCVLPGIQDARTLEAVIGEEMAKGERCVPEGGATLIAPRSFIPPTWNLGRGLNSDSEAGADVT